MSDVREIIARALAADFETMPEHATYRERKSDTRHWYDRSDVLDDVDTAITALNAAGYIITKRESIGLLPLREPTAVGRALDRARNP